ncbi:dihydroorotase [Lactococcus fujiensis]|uniref:Dihydroorotase n=1 Tax=Lactococcus fujiensis JCM 16395 TaxID=1291764 RepID=A0A2A5RK58_9LACT|nr:dihydroorotase [Lactococcus fujiensis]PCR99546.1 dihydroorotase [Lactococcus fujiensis JCM 16395]
MKLIKNGRLIDPKSNFDGQADLLIDGEKIVKIAPVIVPRPHDEIIDASGKIVAPGLVDIHVHFREPGQTQKETIHTGALAAAAGGFTSVVMMANTNPVLSSPELVRATMELAAQEKIHIHTLASITNEFDGKTLTDFEALLEAGAIGFSDDGIPIKSSRTLKNALDRAKTLNVMLSIHEEDPDLIDQLGVNGSDEVRKNCGIEGAPDVSEYSMIARDLMIAYHCQSPLHIQHLSTGLSVDLVRFAKTLGAPISAEVTPQHFSLTENALDDAGTNAKVNPPLRKSKDIDKIIAGLLDGTIDVIATDHAPHTVKEKAQSLRKSPSGMIGLETSLQLGLTHLVASKHLTLLELIRKMSTNPARLYNLDAGYLAEKGPADLIIFDAQIDQEVPSVFQSRATNSPFIHQKVKGQVVMTLCKGQIVFKKNK